MPCRTAILTFAMGAILAAPLSASDRTWGFVNADDRKEMIYGLPDSDDVVLTIGCSDYLKGISVTFTPETTQMKDGRKATLVLATDSDTQSFKGKAVYQEFYGFSIIEAENVPVGTLRPLVTSGEDLHVELQDEAMIIPVGNAKKKFAKMFKACGV